MDEAFWTALDRLAGESRLVIDRPKGSAHPRYPDFVYPLDYGYLDGTASMDGGGIDCWVGSDPRRQIDAILCIVDLLKRDSEIKILIRCIDASMHQCVDVPRRKRSSPIGSKTKRSI